MQKKSLVAPAVVDEGLLDCLVVGAGPAGLACALDLSASGQLTRVIDLGCIAHSIYRFPDGMRFFSDGPSLEFNGFRMPVQGTRPTRMEAMRYYRNVVCSAGIDVRQRETVLSIEGQSGNFHVKTSRHAHRARCVIIATGFYGAPNLLGVLGEDLQKVTHYYRDAHPYSGQDVAVIGGRNSAGTVAVELADAGARVTLVHHRDRFGMKPFIASDLQSCIEQGKIKALLNSRAIAICESYITVETSDGQVEIANDFVFAMTGYQPDFGFLRRNGLPLSSCGTRPDYNPETLESGRAGVYYAGAIIAGINTHEIGIEEARHHGKKIVGALLRKSSPSMILGTDSQTREVGYHARANP